jgi:hypothetical protein
MNYEYRTFNGSYESFSVWLATQSRQGFKFHSMIASDQHSLIVAVAVRQVHGGEE